MQQRRFPLTFFLWDIITEVYGFKRARQLIGFYVLCQIVFAGLIFLTLTAKGDPDITNIQEFSLVLGSIPRITIAMIIAVSCGDYINCYILQKLKNYTKGKHLWFRLIGETAIGEAVVSVLWVAIFYWHRAIHPNLLNLVVSQYIIKVLFEVFSVPITYIIVYLLKKYDIKQITTRYTNFNPETLKPL